MINLLIRLLIDGLNEYAYNAEIAGIQYKVMNNIYGFMVMALWHDNSQLVRNSAGWFPGWFLYQWRRFSSTNLGLET